jgi:hypothetical protein
MASTGRQRSRPSGPAPAARESRQGCAFLGPLCGHVDQTQVRVQGRPQRVPCPLFLIPFRCTELVPVTWIYYVCMAVENAARDAGSGAK